MSSKDKKSFFEWMNSPLFLVIITSVIIGVPAYFGKYFFEQKSQENNNINQFKDSQYKKLYDESKPKVLALRESMGALLSLLENEHSLSTLEYKTPLSKFRKAISSYDSYVYKLEHYGNTDHVAAAKVIQNFNHEVYSYFSSQFSLVQELQTSIEEMILGSYKDSARNNPNNYVKFYMDKIHNDLHKVINSENALYYKYRSFHIPVFDILDNQLIYTFRSSIGLGSTAEIAKSYKNAKNINKLKKDSLYIENKIPFFVAKNRVFLSRDFAYTNDEFLTQKDSWLKAKMFGKMMMKVIDNNPELKEKMEENIKTSGTNHLSISIVP